MVGGYSVVEGGLEDPQVRGVIPDKRILDLRFGVLVAQPPIIVIGRDTPPRDIQPSLLLLLDEVIRLGEVRLIELDELVLSGFEVRVGQPQHEGCWYKLKCIHTVGLTEVHEVVEQAFLVRELLVVLHVV